LHEGRSLSSAGCKKVPLAWLPKKSFHESWKLPRNPALFPLCGNYFARRKSELKDAQAHSAAQKASEFQLASLDAKGGIVASAAICLSAESPASWPPEAAEPDQPIEMREDANWILSRGRGMDNDSTRSR
jgi:hypothetical protein